MLICSTFTSVSVSNHNLTVSGVTRTAASQNIDSACRRIGIDNAAIHGIDIQDFLTISANLRPVIISYYC